LKPPLILEIKGNSLDDGPGIRSVVFFKGCPLSCFWCHNPESKRAGMEIAFDGGECVACNSCLEICQEDALSKGNPVFINRQQCSLCCQCVDNCPSGALSRVGSYLSIDKIVAQVVKDKPFFETSGGGVTLSGGEPTINMDFTADLLKSLKDVQIHTLMETCGFFDFEKFEKKIYPLLDMIYFDIKLIDPHHHKRYCGTSNRIILENFCKLYNQYRDGGIEILPRVPLIPEITDTAENIYKTAAFLNKYSVKRVALLPYHPLWQEKNRKIGVCEKREDHEIIDKFLDQERIDFCKAVFTDAGIELDNHNIHQGEKLCSSKPNKPAC